ncbi:hypothetical protein AXG93_4265s1000 [Marchantia polymorpha subsp. ruderalis]|uniref:Uncharacterized protein n=1 Tax=Marchantia polymorpha subsp. ruderalis TaxID=1480154 RepID=A0A176VU43_MARPO|nr:hypothetical protein AXG93_4265s1000 [Marchantia polymorpha subsp. ruderalis]
METTDDEEALGGDEVAKEKDNNALATPSEKFDKAEDAVEECPTKRRKLQRIELAAVLQRLGLDRKLEEKATADSAGVGPVPSWHQSE